MERSAATAAPTGRRARNTLFAGSAGLALLLVLTLGPGLACSREKREVARARAVEPLLVSSGKPSAPKALAEEVLEEIRFDNDLAGWEVRGGVTGGAWPLLAERATGVVVQPEDTRTPAQRERGLPVPEFQLLGEGLELDADRATSLVFRAAFSRAGVARLYFRHAGASEAFGNTDFVDVSVRPSREPEDWVFDMSGHPGWSGQMNGLRLHPAARDLGVMLEGVRAVDRDLLPGPSATEIDGELRDAGLIQLAIDDPARPLEVRYEARRSYPALAGEDLFLPLRLVDDQVVSFSFALPPDTRRTKGAVQFELLLADELDGAAGPEAVLALAGGARSLFARSLDPGRDAQRWFTGQVQLPDGKGENALLFLRTTGGRPTGRVNGLWGPVHLAPGDRDEGPPSVLLITADTLRADHLGCYGAEGARTPTIDALAERGARFVDAFSTCNATSPAHASILTGLYPKDHRVLGNDYLMPEQVPTLAEAMRASGRTTIASTTVRHLDSRTSGMGQGFDVYLDTPPPNNALGRQPYRSATEAHRVLFDVLAGVGPTPFFAWVHYYDPHTPYLPEPEFAQAFWDADAHTALQPGEEASLVSRLAQAWLAEEPQRGVVPGSGGRKQLAGDELIEHFLRQNPHLGFLGESRQAEFQRAMYRAEISQLDRDLGRLLAHLAELGALDRTIVVFTADHGESLGERDIWFAHEGVYGNTLHVPLILAGPGIPKRVVARAVGTVDIVPTLGDLLGLALMPGLPGVSLMGEMNGDGAGDTAPTRWFQYGQNHEAGFRTDDLHFILVNKNHARGTFDHPVPAGTTELYDLRTDPGELNDVAKTRAQDADRAAARVRGWLQEHAFLAETQLAELTEADQAALKELGYTGD